jgi:hypothetical protein
MLSAEALDLFGQLLATVKLDALDPDLETKAALLTRARAELAGAIAAAKEAEADSAGH